MKGWKISKTDLGLNTTCHRLLVRLYDAGLELPGDINQYYIQRCGKFNPLSINYGWTWSLSYLPDDPYLRTIANHIGSSYTATQCLLTGGRFIDGEFIPFFHDGPRFPHSFLKKNIIPEGLIHDR